MLFAPPVRRQAARLVYVEHGDHEQHPQANGTIADHPVSSIAIQAARTVCTSLLVTAEMPSTRYTTTAPIQPTEKTRWTMSASLRMPGAMVTAAAQRTACDDRDRAHHPRPWPSGRRRAGRAPGPRSRTPSPRAVCPGRWATQPYAYPLWIGPRWLSVLLKPLRG